MGLYHVYCKFGTFCEGFIFALKIKHSHIDGTILLSSNEEKSCTSRDFFFNVLMLFVKIENIILVNIS